MTMSDRPQLRTGIVGIALIPLTALSIYFIYGSGLFSKWPWVRFSIAMAAFTCLWPYVVWFFRVTEKKEDVSHFLSTRYRSLPTEGYSLAFAVMAVPFNVLLLHPGATALGIDSDSHIETLIGVLMIIHGCGFYWIQRGIQSYLRMLFGTQYD